MSIAALYVNNVRHVLLDPEELSGRAKQALDTLESYRARLEEVTASLLALEVEDLASIRDVAAVAGRQEMVWRIGVEISALLAELGTAGRLLRLQYDELISGVDQERRLLAREYAPGGGSEEDGETALTALAQVPPESLIEPEAVAQAMGLETAGQDVDSPISPRGFRLLARIPGLNSILISRIVEHFESLQAILGASLEDFIGVGGLARERARPLREGLSRVAETATLERFV
jgi:diadenylate cyclase